MCTKTYRRTSCIHTCCLHKSKCIHKRVYIDTYAWVHAHMHNKDTFAPDEMSPGAIICAPERTVFPPALVKFTWQYPLVWFVCLYVMYGMIYVCVCMYVRMYVRAWTSVWMKMCVYVCMCVCVCVTSVWTIYVHMYVCMYVCMCVRKACMYAHNECMHDSDYVRMYKRVYVCTYVRSASIHDL
jgi:hypothetical protein